MSTASIIKVMCVFWIALLIQVKFNKNARKIVIKTLYILGGMITVFGTVGTTGVLIIKHIKKRKNSSTISEVDA
jgi:cytochrome c oxidase assembly factor CtaG